MRRGIPFLTLFKNVDRYDDLFGELVESHAGCKKIMALEGVSVINAVSPYIKLCSEEDGDFNTGVISKTVRDSSMRSNLVTGAMSFIQHMVKRQPTITKEFWVQRFVERRGKRFF